MDRERALKELKPRIEQYLQSKGIDTRQNFKCLNPDHSDNNPSMGLDRERYQAHCFSCGARYDIVDLIKLDSPGLDDRGAFDAAYRLFNIDAGGSASWTRSTAESDFNDADWTQQPPAVQQPKPAAETGPQDYSAYFTAAHDRIGQTDYPQRRGLDQAIIDRFQLGYDPDFQAKDASGNHTAWKALIIPNGPHSFIARNTDPGADHKDRIRKRGPQAPFNLQAIDQAAGPVFIVEGEIDALSVIQAGGAALSIPADGIRSLLKALENKKPQQPLIISLDKDAVGQEAEKELLAGLDKLQIQYIQADIAGASKDANAAMLADPAGFTQAVQVAQQSIIAALEAAQEAERKAYLSTSAAGHMAAFKGQIAASIDTKPLKTGFNLLDGFMDGGLYEGLYCIGGGTGSGKTAIALQIADNVASEGTDVLIFSLEMARYELMARSISRLTLMNCLLNKISTANAKSTRDILSGARHLQYSQAETDLYNRALAEYETLIADHIYISEGIGNIGADQIRGTIEKHITFTGRKPFVLVDYLQLLAPYNERYTDKQNTDKAVLELKRISRDYKTPVMAVSSLNRASYSNNVDLEAFKESGAIEYSSDVLLGLQYQGTGDKGFDKDAAAQEPQRKMELRILKQRNAPKGMSVLFDFYSYANYLHETGMILKKPKKASKKDDE